MKDKISAKLAINIKCPECDIVLVNSDLGITCKNMKCYDYLVTYEYPTIELTVKYKPLRCGSTLVIGYETKTD